MPSVGQVQLCRRPPPPVFPTFQFGRVNEHLRVARESPPLSLLSLPSLHARIVCCPPPPSLLFIPPSASPPPHSKHSRRYMSPPPPSSTFEKKKLLFLPFVVLCPFFCPAGTALLGVTTVWEVRLFFPPLAFPTERYLLLDATTAMSVDFSPPSPLPRIFSPDFTLQAVHFSSPHCWGRLFFPVGAPQKKSPCGQPPPHLFSCPT